MSGSEHKTTVATGIRLIDDEARHRVIEHRLIESLRHGPIDPRTLTLMMGQYWHPIHYFTEFLARCVAVMGDIRLASPISLILYQELGQGDSQRAHECLYLEAAQQAGISLREVINAVPLPQTEALMKGFREATATRLQAIGYLYATEVIDLRLVRSLGAAITRVTGGVIPEWVKVHEQQEGDHVTSARALTPLLAPTDHDELVVHVRSAWKQWQNFYDGIDAAVSASMAEGT